MTGSQRVGDEELVRRCQSELPYATDAFEALVRRYESAVFGVCLRYLGVREDAEEVAQDVFTKAFRGIPRFEFKSSFRTWLFRIANNECATRYRNTRRRQEVRERYALEQGAGETSREEDQQTDSELSAPMERALGLLSEKDREALLMRHTADLSFEELAEALGVGLSAAKMRVYRAEERFRALFRDAAAEM